MIDFFVWIILAFIIVVSIIDFKVKAIPSIFLTSFLFAVAVIHPANLIYGICGLIMALLLFESGFFGGLGDIKVLTIISFIINSTKDLFILIFFVMLIGIAWKYYWYLQFKARRKKLPDEFPFIPVFAFVYILLMILGVLA